MEGPLNNLKVSMIQFRGPRRAYRKDDKFRHGLAHQIDAREAFAKPPLASESMHRLHLYLILNYYVFTSKKIYLLI